MLEIKERQVISNLRLIKTRYEHALEGWGQSSYILGDYGVKLGNTTKYHARVDNTVPCTKGYGLKVVR
jgi:hypothetical protein